MDAWGLDWLTAPSNPASWEWEELDWVWPTGQWGQRQDKKGQDGNIDSGDLLGKVHLNFLPSN